MHIERLDERFIDEAARLCAEHTSAQAIPDEMLARPSREDARSGIAAMLWKSVTSGQPPGFVAVEDGHVHAVLAGISYHLTTNDFGYVYRPPAHATLPFTLRAAASPTIAGEIYPALLAAWRDVAITEGLTHLILTSPVACWWENALWRRCGLRQMGVEAAQPCAGWHPSTPPAPPGSVIRIAEPDDIEAITNLSLEEHLYHATIPGLGVSPDQSRDLTRRLTEEGLASEHSRYLLLETVDTSGGERHPLGFICGFLDQREPHALSRLYFPPRFGYLSIASVTETARGQGVGRVLYDELMSWFVAQDIPAVFLHYANTNPLSSRFWPRMGFAPYLEELYLVLR
jgi:ribosomal protein S18 acetylase RimI-like enzyme